MRRLFQTEVRVITAMEPVSMGLMGTGEISLMARATDSHLEWVDRPWWAKVKSWMK